MKKNKPNYKAEPPLNLVQDEPITYGFINMSEDERLLLDAKKTGIEKLMGFTKMIRRNAMFNAFVTPPSNTD